MSHGCSPSTKLIHSVALGTWHAQGPSDNAGPVYREKELFVLTILWPGSGHFTAENADGATIFSLMWTSGICSLVPRLQVSAKICLGTLVDVMLGALIRSNPECRE